MVKSIVGLGPGVGLGVRGRIRVGMCTALIVCWWQEGVLVSRLRRHLLRVAGLDADSTIDNSLQSAMDAASEAVASQGQYVLLVIDALNEMETAPAAVCPEC